MKREQANTFLSALLIIFCFLFFNCKQQESPTKEIVEKSIQAAGGKEKISQINNYSFKLGQQTIYVSTDGLMKILSGKSPVITEVIFADAKNVKRNCYDNKTEPHGLQKSTYQGLAMLRSGLFTLKNFKDQLTDQGVMTFGPKELHLLTTQIDDLQMEFYLDPEEFTLQRLVFTGFDEQGDKYEVNHDYGLYQEIDGINIPSSFFSSQVGTRGRLQEISEVKLNQELSDDFFSSLELNMGTVKIGEGILDGNITDFSFQRNMLMIGTNWTDKCINQAGFKSTDKLALKIKDMEVEIDFYDSPPPRSEMRDGAKIMIPNQREENYLIYLLSSDYKIFAEELEPLLPIQIKRKE